MVKRKKFKGEGKKLNIKQPCVKKGRNFGCHRKVEDKNLIVDIQDKVNGEREWTGNLMLAAGVLLLHIKINDNNRKKGIRGLQLVSLYNLGLLMCEIRQYTARRDR